MIKVTIAILVGIWFIYWKLGRELRKAAFKERAFRNKSENERLIKIAKWLLW